MTGSAFSDILKARLRDKGHRRCLLNDFLFNPDQIIKQEQYKDFHREAQRRRLIKAAAQPEPRYIRRVPAALRKPILRLGRHLPNLRPLVRARI
jgi:hypothetical protein